MPPRKIAPLTPKLTLTQPLTLTGGQLSKGAIVWLPPNPKTKPNLDPKPIPNRGQLFSGSNCPDTSLNKINVFCLIVTDYKITKKLKIKEKITSNTMSFNIVKHVTLKQWNINNSLWCGSIHLQMLLKMDVFTIFTEKHLCWRPSLKKMQAWRPEGLQLY